METLLTKPEYLNALNPAQQDAVEQTEGPLLVLAGAGTGKTRVLTNRIVHIIEQNLAEPQNILAVTFTNKAAREMSDRISNMIPCEGLNIGTFHSICTRMLRSHISLAVPDLTSQFSIIDQDEQLRLIKSISADNNIDVKTYTPKLLHVIISRWKDQGLAAEKIGDHDLPLPAHRIASFIYKEYQRQMIASNAMDFGDILLYCNELLIKHPDVLKHYQQRYKYILIDEYQDTNAVQYVWARMLASGHHNICCVGDDDQSIYSWRGAEVKNILRFEKDFPEATVIKLEQNYRSTSHILTAASSIISNNKSRHSKKLWTEANKGNSLQVISCWNDREEARFVASEIERLVANKEYSANQAAVLVRAGFQTRAFEEVFISNAIPYFIIGGLRFYDRKEVRDALAYIRLCMNQSDNLALERIINVPKRSIGNVSLKKIKDYASEHDISVFESIKMMLEQKLLKGKAADSLQAFVRLIEDFQNKYDHDSASEVTKELLDQSGYVKALKEEKTDESRSRLENINEMLRAIDEFDNIFEFIEHSSLVMDNESIENDYGGAVKIMTLHAAKGLEFDLVFLPGWEEGIFPHQKAIDEDGDKGLEEERRIAYVGITRAKKQVYISYAETRRVFGDFINSLPSRFLAEIPDEICQRRSSSGKLNYRGTSHNFSMQNSIKKAPQNSSTVKSYIDNNGKPRPGNKVSHNKFGNGIVVSIDGDFIEVAFEKIGLKTIKKDYLNYYIK